jgi:ATP-dependent DNA helicase RecQ
MKSQQNLKESLKKYFDHQEFRDGQEEIIKSIISGRDTFTLLPTGAGKSLCYQLPAVLMPGCALVISPLIALMQDQITRLFERNIASAYINSTLSLSVAKEVLNSFVSGQLKILYISPERLESREFLSALAVANVSFLVIDEAHCISEWGHDFRPSYRKINKIFDIIPNLQKTTFTATATKKVSQDIITSAHLREPNIFVSGFDRPNLEWITERSDNRENRIIEILSEQKKPSIIYCPTRKKVDELSKILSKQFKNISIYHAGFTLEFRAQQQDLFLNGKNNIMIATNAFGMGIDKSDVGLVLHYGFPQTIESYYQEAGRAGRDGSSAKCILLWGGGDKGLQDFFIESNHPDINTFEQVRSFLLDNINVLEEYEGVFLSSKQIASALDLNYSSVSIILKKFEEAGAIKQINSPKQMRVKIISSRESLEEYYSHQSPENKELMESFFRSLPSSVFRSYIEIDLPKLISKYDLNAKDLDSLLKKLKYSEMINFSSHNWQSGYLISGNISNLSEMGIDFKKIEEHRSDSNEKLREMVSYVFSTKCKRNIILKYFGEKIIKRKCGNCSSCDNQNKSNIKIVKPKKLTKKIIPDNNLHEKIKSNILMGDSFVNISKNLKIKKLELTKQMINLSRQDFKINPESLFGEEICQNIEKIIYKNPGITFREIQYKSKTNLTLSEIKVIRELLK